MRALLAVVFVLSLGACAKGAGSGGGDDIDAAANVRPDAEISTPAPDARPPLDAAPPDSTPVTPGVVDTCAQGQDLTTAALTASGATVSGDNTGYANDLQPPSTCTGYTPDGPDAVYFVTATAGQSIMATVTPTWDASIFITQTCTLNATCLIGADANASTSPETVTWSVTSAGTYYVIVESWDPGAYGPYSLNVKLQ